ncbi:MAG: pyridoxine 5'-phosphate synthase [Epsilonproteobacteria bacterium]|nr:pyridoxine 5'-phosphate synthase [Campylobacterota bacterium]
MILGVNIDHIAVLREARKVNDPDILEAMYIAIQAGADQITIHLREDRRHIHDNDAYRIAKLSKVPVNLECSINEEIIDIVCDIKPTRATLVPEKREEVTTEGGLDVLTYKKQITKAVQKLKNNGIDVSLFIDPDFDMIDASKETGANMIELHTGSYANIYAMLYGNLSYSHHCIKTLDLPKKELEKKLQRSLKTLKNAAKYGKKINLEVAAGHGLNYQNVIEITKIKQIQELNIGQSIIARSVFSGLDSAIKEMKQLCSQK